MLFIKNTNYDKRDLNQINQSIAIKDSINYFMQDKSKSFEDALEQCSIPIDAVVEQSVTKVTIDLSKISLDTKRSLIELKQKIKRIRRGE